ncbi:TraR/DksA C4-type zinc finger protein [Roseovarius salis]|uniref:TraR/DksA family transcriptional regulator n=1 Tax=Roseovarius salis TaxID=3376063 RepID=UPI0037C5B0A8
MPDVAHYRKVLLDRLAELDSRLHRIESDLDAPHSKDWEESAVEREDDEVLEGLGHQGETEIARIRAALKRIRDGNYGICTRCGDEISGERLDTLPDTPFCRECAAQI